jgi:hypothetical protein
MSKQNNLYQVTVAQNHFHKMVEGSMALQTCYSKRIFGQPKH